MQYVEVSTSIREAVDAIPSGLWGIGVSGGADSVALLRAVLACRGDVSLHVIHLDHQARGQQSADDAEFVRGLATQWGLPSTIQRLDSLPAEGEPGRNVSSRFRDARMKLFRLVAETYPAMNPSAEGESGPSGAEMEESSFEGKLGFRGSIGREGNSPPPQPSPGVPGEGVREVTVCAAPEMGAAERNGIRDLMGAARGTLGLRGVLLAHHSDDQAETILQRLLRGSGPMGVCGMQRETRVRSLTIVRPLLEIRAATLRDWLRSIDQPWREDASNASDRYQRNRLRQILHADPVLTDRLLELGRANARLADWARQHAPTLPTVFACGELSDLPAVLAREAARVWLIREGALPGELTRATLDRLLTLAGDLASPRAQVFPGNLRVRRRAGKVFVDREG